MGRKRLRGVWLLLLISSFAIAQEPNCFQQQLSFESITVDEGLSNNYVFDICQDSVGFLWIATQNGLNRYDGNDILNYGKHFNKNCQLSSTIINELFLDSKGILWIGGDGGLDSYNLKLDQFNKFSHSSLTTPLNQIYCMDEDRNGILWFGGNTGLYAYDSFKNELRHYSNRPGNKTGFPARPIYKILIDERNRIWISVLDEGLFLLDTERNQLISYRNIPGDPASLSGNRVEKIYEDRKGNIWVGTFNKGLNLFEEDRKAFKRFIPEKGNEYSMRVRAIFEDLKGNFYVGTRAGVYLFDPKQESFLHYAFEGHKTSHISQNSITCSFIDENKTLWLGTYSGGINHGTLIKKEFTIYSPGPSNGEYLNSANINSITEDQHGNLWVGGEQGLNIIDRNSCQIAYYTNDPSDPYSLSHNDVKALEWDKNKNLWIGTNQGGLNHLDLKTGEFTRFLHDPLDPTSIAGDKIYGLLNDQNNNLWIILSSNNSFVDLNIDLLPDGSKKFIHLDQHAFFGLAEDSFGRVFIGADSGFHVFDPVDSTFSYYENPEQISSANVIYPDSRGNVWIGSLKGLCKYDISTGISTLYSQENGYPVQVVYGILEDDTENLWVSTNAGLLKIDALDKDSATINFRIYDHYDGLQSKQFNLHAFYKCRDGALAFGGINGMNVFYPDQILENHIPAEVMLTNLSISGKKVSIGEDILNATPLHQSLASTKNLTLGPKQNIFSIEFSTLQTSDPDDYLYRTKLLHLEDDWTYKKAGNNMVTYTNLAPGDYTLLISAANSDGYWNSNPTQLNITIEPHFYQTWFFRIALFLVISGLIIAIYYYRVRSIRKRNRDLEKLVELRTSEITEKNMMLMKANSLLEEQQDEILVQKEELENHKNNLESIVEKRTLDLEQALEKAKESEALKSAFLANMSHEIRTPMNAIIGFSSMLNDKERSREERLKYVEIINSNSKSLLKLIDEILDISLMETRQVKISRNSFDLNNMLDHLYSYYSMNNEKKEVQFRLKNEIEKKQLSLFSDSVRIKQVLTNLLDNALKFTKQGHIELGVYIKNDDICFYVKDTGRGIPQSEQEKIFEQFVKLESYDTTWTRGLGLGLAIAHKIAEALNGMLKVDSQPGEGSTFTLCLPLQSVLKEEELKREELASGSKQNWKNKKILIAEDVEENYLYLKTLLKGTGAIILWAQNGEEALEKIFEKPDLILMDIKMPLLDGYEAAKRIKKSHPEQVIIAQTAYATLAEKTRFNDSNFNEYIEKPIYRDDLFLLLNKYLSDN